MDTQPSKTAISVKPHIEPKAMVWGMYVTQGNTASIEVS